MKSSHTCNLPIPNLPKETIKAHIFKELASGSLLYIGQLCNVGYTTHFTKEKLYIFFKRKLIIQGTTQLNKLWTIDAPPPIKDSINSVVDAPTMADRISFYHASLFSPTIATLEEAIREGYLTTLSTFTTTKTKELSTSLQRNFHGTHVCNTRQQKNSTSKIFLYPTSVKRQHYPKRHNRTSFKAMKNSL